MRLKMHIFKDTLLPYYEVDLFLMLIGAMKLHNSRIKFQKLSKKLINNKY